MEAGLFPVHEHFRNFFWRAGVAQNVDEVGRILVLVAIVQCQRLQNDEGRNVGEPYRFSRCPSAVKQLGGDYAFLVPVVNDPDVLNCQCRNTLAIDAYRPARIRFPCIL